MKFILRDLKRISSRIEEQAINYSHYSKGDEKLAGMLNDWLHDLESAISDLAYELDNE